jgi:hypothetical protein
MGDLLSPTPVVRASPRRKSQDISCFPSKDNLTEDLLRLHFVTGVLIGHPAVSHVFLFVVLLTQKGHPAGKKIIKT